MSIFSIVMLVMITMLALVFLIFIIKVVCSAFTGISSTFVNYRKEYPKISQIPNRYNEYRDEKIGYYGDDGK